MISSTRFSDRKTDLNYLSVEESSVIDYFNWSNAMKLIKDLGTQLPKPGNKRKVRMGLYECPLCLNVFKLQAYNVKNKTGNLCNSCTNKTHGLTHHPLFRKWSDMKSRCGTKGNAAYPSYGAKGITVCVEWGEFQPFYDWAMSHGYKSNLSIDRIDTYGNYSPDNCRFADKTTQSINQRIKVNNKSGYIGVYLNKKHNKWYAQIRYMGKRIWLGAFEKCIDAAKARDFYIMGNQTGHPLNLKHKEVI